MASEASREGRRKEELSLSLHAQPRTRVSFRVLLSRDFSRLPQMKSVLAG